MPVLAHQYQQDSLQLLKSLLEGGSFRWTKAAQDDAASSIHLTHYGGLIFTSQRAVEGFVKILDEAQGASHQAGSTEPLLSPDCPLYVVGGATQRALLASVHVHSASVVGAHTGNGEALAAYIVSHYPRIWDKPTRLLFLVGQQHRTVIPHTLAAAEIPVQELVVYDAAPSPSFSGDLEAALRRLEEPSMASADGVVNRQASQGPVWILIFSPAGCKELLDRLGRGRDRSTVEARLRRKVLIATIGPTTRDFLRDEFGVLADVCADAPTPEGVALGIRRYMQRLGD